MVGLGQVSMECLCWGFEGCASHIEAAALQGGEKIQDMRWRVCREAVLPFLWPSWLWVGDSTLPFLPPLGSQSGAPSVPMLLCSILIPGCGSSSMGTRCRPRGSPAAYISPGRGLPTLVHCSLELRMGLWLYFL